MSDESSTLPICSIGGIFILPLNRFLTVLLQVFVAARELMLSEPSATIGREWRRMNTLEYEVALTVNHIGLAAGIAAPQHIYKMFTLAGKGGNG